MGQLYSALKYLRFPKTLEALADQRVVAPVHVRIKPTNVCNHNCWYCAYRADGLQLGDEMNVRDRIPEDKMMQIVDDLIAMDVKAVTFSGGGEPLLYKPLPQVVRRLGAAGIRVASLTNGSNLQGDVAAALAEHATWVRVSVDAWDDDSYVKSRGARPGDFTKLMGNLEQFVKMTERCTVGISFIAGKDNHAHILDMCRRFKAIGVNHVKVACTVVGNTAAENNAYYETFAEAAAGQIRRAKAELDDDRFTVVNHFHEAADMFDKPYASCPFLMYLTVIGADLNVYTCQDKAYTTTGRLGSIKERSFKDFWFSDENRARLFGLDPSKDCRHHCIAHTKNLSILDYLSLDREHADFV